VLFAIELATRRVKILGIVHEPYGAWMEQVARNATDAFSGFVTGKRYLITARDPRFTKELRSILGAAGVEVIRTPPRSPNLKGYASCCTSWVLSDMNWFFRVFSGYLRPCILRVFGLGGS
jgi:putative transposase